jgi:LysM repeat protein
VWRRLIALLAVLLVAPSGVASAAESSVHLTIDASTGSVTSVLVPSEATLDCDDGASGSGFLAKAAKPACALARKGTVRKIAAEHRRPRVCVDVFGGPQRATIRGTVRGRRVSMTIDRSDGCGIDDWNRLLPLLGDPERRGVIPKAVKASSTTTTTAPPTTYVVQRGDTLTEIAKRFRTSVHAIVATNQLADPDSLREGQQLAMPPPGTVRIEVKMLDDGPSGSTVGLVLVGAEPSERVTFVITLPDGNTYTGTPHSASGYGVVATKYEAELERGTYRVTATGERGTNAETSFHLKPPA